MSFLKRKPRINKSKEQLKNEHDLLQKVSREKQLVKLMFPLIEGQTTVYNAQTVLAALSGFIKASLDQKMAEVLVKELVIDLSKEKDSEIKQAVVALLGLVEVEKAKDTAALLERFANILAQHSAHEYMKQPMKVIKVEDLVA